MDKKLEELYAYLNSGMGATEYDFKFHVKEILSQAIEEAVKERLERIIQDNHDEQTDTHDYDGIAMEVFRWWAEVNQLQQKEEGK